jgi:hypothetical protein
MPRTSLVLLAVLLVGEAHAQTTAKAPAPAPAGPAAPAVARPSAPAVARPSAPAVARPSASSRIASPKASIRKNAARPRGNPNAIIQPPTSALNAGSGPIRPTLFGPLDLKTMRRSDQVALPPAGPTTSQNTTNGIRPGLSFAPGQIPLPGGNNPTDRRNYQMTSYLNANGGLTTIVYDKQTGLSRAYNQSVSFDGNYGGPLPPGISRNMPGPAIGVTNWPYTSLSGSVANPDVDRTGPYATGRLGGDGPGGPTGALGSINSAIPTYGGSPPTGFAPSNPTMGGMPSLSLSPPPAGIGVVPVP